MNQIRWLSGGQMVIRFYELYDERNAFVIEQGLEEFEYLFNLIKNSTFKGTELEIIYSIILKLQKRYLEKKQ